jgi:LemA protein
MGGIIDFVANLFWLLVWLGAILGVIALASYNKLQSLGQEVKEKASNIQVAVSKKVQLVNQLGDVVRGYQQAEQLTVLKVSQDNTAQAVAGAYRDSGQLLATIQSTAQRFPELQASQQYHRLIDSIQYCEANIEARRNEYNDVVKRYNSKRGSIPAVFVARIIGFPMAPHLEFDISGAEEQSLRRFETPDGEQLVRLLGNAGERVSSSARRIAQGAVDAGALTAQRVVDAVGHKPDDTTPRRYFYMSPGGVPKGPMPLAGIREQVAAGNLPTDLLVAEDGSDSWTALASLQPG